MTFPGPLSWPSTFFHGLNLAILENFLDCVRLFPISFVCRCKTAKIILISMAFYDPHLNSMTFQAWKKKIYISRTSHVFYYPCKLSWLVFRLSRHMLSKPSFILLRHLSTSMQHLHSSNMLENKLQRTIYTFAPINISYVWVNSKYHYSWHQKYIINKLEIPNNWK